MNTDDALALYDQLKHAERVREDCRDDLHQAALQVAQYLSDLVADGRVRVKPGEEWLVAYVETFNACWTADMAARAIWRELAARLDVSDADTPENAD